ncbi:MAG TPA: hypothetical protein VE270_01175, partial [Thermoleophilaceae bacterium]|nr:hypothetical protein [Thermoleophilaceae bacterium]
MVTTSITVAIGRPAPRLAPPTVLADASSIDCARRRRRPRCRRPGSSTVLSVVTTQPRGGRLDGLRAVVT